MVSLPTISQYLALFQELYPITELTDLTAEAWAVALDDVDDMAFVWAARRLLREEGRRYFPTPNEVRSYLATATVLAKLPSNDPVTKAIDQLYADTAKRSQRLTFQDASRE